MINIININWFGIKVNVVDCDDVGFILLSWKFYSIKKVKIKDKLNWIMFILCRLWFLYEFC